MPPLEAEDDPLQIFQSLLVKPNRKHREIAARSRGQLESACEYTSVEVLDGAPYGPAAHHLDASHLLEPPEMVCDIRDGFTEATGELRRTDVTVGRYEKKLQPNRVGEGPEKLDRVRVR